MKQKLIQITAGRGPAECCWVVAQVLKYFLKEVQEIGLSYEVIHRSPGNENATLQSATVKLKGSDVDAFLKKWLGTIQWVGTSTFRKYHKRKNWFIGVFELDTVVDQKIATKDISYQAIRSSGPGGQNVNKVNSAVRATHMSTGITVVAMDSRSQHQNKKLATERLKQKVWETHLDKVKQIVTDQWENHLNLQRGNPVRVFKGTDFKKMKKETSFKHKRNQLKNDLRNQIK
ncbi:peptide chain release factor H [Aquimarina brevivitae]|uniref:Peptide chain release factor n=1 Tax=Aquimarina brevivitae TaxID=323412 RepID=A0A4V2F7D9_9FLAO|nr:peptide chain release factor H [Aquimarina brevivitae]RZS99479.1 peptide chain release factor [Aquimarina brevivitae]